MRRTFALGWTFFGLSLAAPAFGQADGAGKFRDMFIQLDANGDTVLEKSEIPESAHEAFNRLLKRGDSNKNGKLELEELRGLGQKVATLNTPEMAANRFKVMDKDNDGKITHAEFTGVAANFDRIDTDKDGSLSKDELTKWVASEFASQGAAKAKKPRAALAKAKAKKDAKPETSKSEPKKEDAAATKPESKPSEEETADPVRRFKTLDKDGDGKVSKSEFPREKLFDRLDADKDGFLTPTELAKFMKPGK